MAVKRSAGISKPKKMTDVEIRRRRVVYRARHRGTKELDWLLGRFAEARVAAMTPAQLESFERLLMLSDPELYDLIMQPEAARGGAYASVIASVRAFHGLDPDAVPGPGKP